MDFVSIIVIYIGEFTKVKSRCRYTADDVTYTCVLMSVAIFFESRSDYSGNYEHTLI